MFQGFNESTIMYYEAIRKENCKRVYQDNERLYLDGVKSPLDELYFELYHYFHEVDRDLLSNRRRCISSAYNDARFCCGAPLKEYFYIRFKLNKTNKKNALGFFFDASLDGYKYGLDIYKPDASGINKIRDYILDNKHSAKKVIEDFNKAGLLELHGEKYKKAHYPKEDIILQEWLERKRISFIHKENLGAIFYGREILNNILSAFDSVKEVYIMLKEAL
ncbi:MAG: DUF2461 family protein [Lachnospiraceae bacterium]|nr:DUF2461 family protein [Lachnospiraceae bacterium]